MACWEHNTMPLLAPAIHRRLMRQHHHLQPLDSPRRRLGAALRWLQRWVARRRRLRFGYPAGKRPDVTGCLPPLPRNTEVRRLQGLGLVDPYFASQAPDDFDDMLLGREHTIHKVAFSVRPPRARGSSYAHSAAALHRAPRQRQGLALTFTRAGWDRWEWQQPGFFPAGEDEHFDVAYCQRSGVYYVVTPDWVWVLDMGAPVPTLEPLVRMSCGVSLRKVTVGERRHVVILSDDDDDDGGGALSQMYMVIIQEMQQQQRVTVRRYTAGEPWSVVSDLGAASDLGGRALLIANRAQSVSVLPTASSPPWLKRDCVYWMTSDDYGYDSCEPEQGMAPVWRFHVRTNTTDRFVRSRQEQTGADDRMLDWHNSLWLTPSLT